MVEFQVNEKSMVIPIYGDGTIGYPFRTKTS